MEETQRLQCNWTIHLFKFTENVKVGWKGKEAVSLAGLIL